MKRTLIALLATAVLSGCGGGGTSVSNPPPPPPPPPVDYTIYVTASGLTGTLVVQDDKTDTLTFTTNNSPQPLSTAYASGSTYSVTVKTQPSGQTCVLSNSTGTVTADTTVTATCTTNPVYTPHPNGLWTTQNFTLPINPVHALMLNTGNVLFVAGSGNCPPGDAALPNCPQNVSQYGATVWTPSSDVFNSVSQPFDLFCNGAAQLPDGTVLFSGGTLGYATGPAAAIMRAMGHGKTIPGGAMTKAAENMAGHHPLAVPHDATTVADGGFTGSPLSTIFNPATSKFSATSSMVAGRWYPTVTELGDGRLMTYAGQDENSNDNPLAEIWNGTGWGTPIVPYCNDETGTGNAADCRGVHYTDGSQPVASLPALYPRMILLPNGKVIHAGPEPQTWVFDPSVPAPGENWVYLNTTNFHDYRTYGSVVLLPLSPKNNYAAKIFSMGGLGADAGVVTATDTTEILDMTQPAPQQWAYGPNMSQPRVEMNGVLLPNGKVLAIGGSSNDEDVSTASLNAEIYDPATNAFTSAGTTTYAHLYHSTALLLPDGTVFLTGGNPQQGSYEGHMEVYQPSYLFNSDGSPATRPTLSGVPASVSYGATFTVTASNIASVVLMRQGASTHAFDMSQREIGLSFTASGSTLTLTAPPNGNVAPPGYYLLFVLDGNGVPSVGQWVKISN